MRLNEPSIPRPRCSWPSVRPNPHLSVIDVERFAAIGRQHGVETLIDATLATPYNLRPLSYGIDYVLHSATKYLGGHNDLLAGVVIGSAEKMDEVRYLRGIVGGINSPHNCYLLQRGIKTLALRMEQQNKNGLALAEFLEDHPKVERVWYPGLASHRDYEVARHSFGASEDFSHSPFRRRQHGQPVGEQCAYSEDRPVTGRRGITHRAAPLHELLQYDPGTRKAVGIEDTMIRVALGIEDTNDLVADFEQASPRFKFPRP